jgi:hypothetical protein
MKHLEDMLSGKPEYSYPYALSCLVGRDEVFLVDVFFAVGVKSLGDMINQKMTIFIPLSFTEK